MCKAGIKVDAVTDKCSIIEKGLLERSRRGSA